MEHQLALENLVLNLLALARCASALAPETRERLAALAPQVAPDGESLARVSMQMRLILRREPAFRQAEQDLHARRTERYGLKLDKVLESLVNPEEQLSKGRQPLTSVEILADITRAGVADPEALSQDGRWRRLRHTLMPWAFEDDDQ